MIVMKKNGEQILKVYFTHFINDEVHLFIEGNDIPKIININEIETIS